MGLSAFAGFVIVHIVSRVPLPLHAQYHGRAKYCNLPLSSVYRLSFARSVW